VAVTAEPGVSARGNLDARWAWICLVFVPPAFLAGMLIGEGLISLQGFDPAGVPVPPSGPVLLAAIPGVLVIVAPAVVALVFGLRANRAGVRRGLVPAVIGIVVVGYVVITNVLSWILRS
jgi:hypothetical protein